MALTNKTTSEIMEAVGNSYGELLNSLLGKYNCLFLMSQEHQGELDNLIDELGKLTVKIVESNRRELTLNDVISILYDYVTADVDAGTLAEDAVSVLRESGCTFDDICDLGLGWLFGEE